MTFTTLYNTHSSQWDENNPDKQPKNHLGSDVGNRHSFAALCGIKGVEWMGGELDIEEVITENGLCKKCQRIALKISESKT